MDNFKFVSFCLFLSSSAIGITQDIKIQKIDIGIPSQAGLITGFTQDSDGYMWFTTAIGGVYQYDGYTINAFNYQPANPNSIASDRVECVAAGPEGVVWFGNYSKGLDRFDEATSGFRHFRHDSLNPNSLISDNVMTLLVDHASVLWIGTSSGLDRYDPSSDSFTHFHHDPADPKSLSADNISVIYEDKAGTIWVGAGTAFDLKENLNGGLNKLDRASGRFTRFVREADNPNSLVSNCITALFEDSRGVFWIGTAGDGLHSMNQETSEITRHPFDPDHPDKLSRSAITPWAPWVADHITFINEDAYGGILIGTFGGGLSRYDPQRETVSRYPIFSDSTKFTRACWWSHRSRDGIFWMGTWLGGLYRIEAANSGLEYHTLGHTISKVYQQEPGLYWASTKEGLCRYDVVRKKKEVFKYATRSRNGNSEERIITFAQNKEGEFWIGTFSGNIALFNPETGTGKPYHRALFNYPSSTYTINDIMLDQKQNLWIASGAGLEYMNTRTGQFTYYHDQTILPNSPREISTLMEDTNGNIWIGCFQEGGIHMLNIHDNTFHPFFGNKGVTSKLFQDRRGEIWVGANDGLYRLTDVNSDFSPFSFPHSDVIRVDDIMEDHDANLWVICTDVIYRIDSTRNIFERLTKGSNQIETANHALVTFNPVSKSRELFFDTEDGFYVLQPEKITINKVPPEIVITNFRVHHHHDKQLTYVSSKDASYERLEEWQLAYFENNISFEIKPIHYSSPKDNRVVYILEPYDPEWRNAKPDEKIYYFNVPSGRYTLKVRASNANGITAERHIHVYVSPPWWRSMLAYMLYALLFIFLLWKTNSYLRYQAIVKEREKNQQKELLHAKEIEKAYTELQSTQAQLIQSEKMASLGQLTAGIAHEIQNPLNFVNNFSEVNKELLEEMQQSIEKKDLDEIKTLSRNVIENEDKIILHGKRADAIVKSMLQHSRTSTGKKELTDINTLVDEYLRLAYHGLRAKDKSFNAEFLMELDKNLPKVEVIAQDIGRVLLNLINNAFYAVTERAKQAAVHSPQSSIGVLLAASSQKPEANGLPKVTVTTKNLGDNIEIRVKDNGNGIPDHIKDKIFQPFFTTKPTGQGTGLGLSLSYDIVKAHGGEINVESQEGEGTEFIIVLPLTNKNEN